VEILGYRVGTRFLFGTAGDKGAQIAGLKTMFFNPEEYDILPYKNKYTKDGSIGITGYFIPSCSLWFGEKSSPGYDSRGVVYEDKAKQWYENKWSKIKDPHALTKEKAEFCFTAEDAFVLEGDNNFNREKLSE